MEQEILKKVSDMADKLKKEYDRIDDDLDDYDRGVVIGKYMNILDTYNAISKLIREKE